MLQAGNGIVLGIKMLGKHFISAHGIAKFLLMELQKKIPMWREPTLSIITKVASLISTD